jgi:hypothetical protein
VNNGNNISATFRVGMSKFLYPAGIFATFGAAMPKIPDRNGIRDSPEEIRRDTATASSNEDRPRRRRSSPD